MTDDRTAPEPDDAAAAQPTAPLPAPPQAWPSPSAPAPGTERPAWGSPAGPVGEPGAPEWAQPAGPEHGSPSAGSPLGAPPAGPAYGSPPAGSPYGAPYGAPSYGSPSYGPPSYGAPPGGYPYAGGQPAYGTPPARRGRSTAAVVAVAVAGVVALAGVLAAVGAFFAAGNGDPDAAGPVVPAPSFAPPSPGATGGPAPAPTPRRTTTPAPRVPSPTSARAKAYVEQANAYCRATTDPGLKAAAPLARTDPAKYLRESAKVNRALDERLRKDVPKELSSTVGEITKSWDALSEYYEKAADAFEAGDAQVFQQHLDTAQEANERGNDIAKQIGMADCADAGGLGGTDGSGPQPTPGVTA